MRRVSNKGKVETLTRPLQKHVPLDISSTEYEAEVEKEESKGEKLGRSNGNGDISRGKGEFIERSRPTRAAARDALCKLCLMLT